MKVKFVSAKFEYSGFEVGAEYEVHSEVQPRSYADYPGRWFSIVNSIGILTWINVGGDDAFGTWEIVSE